MSSIPDSDFRVEPADYAVDFKDLRAVREPVFVVEQNVPLEMEWDELDPHCHHVIARDAAHRPIGTGRLTPEHKIGRMAVLRHWRGHGVGEALLLALIEQARALGWREVALNAQVSALGFYEKFGFAAYGERFEEAGIEHQAMRLVLAPAIHSPRPAAAARGRSQRPEEFQDLEATVEAVRQVVLGARRELAVYTRDLERAVFAAPGVLDALKQFAIAGRGGVARILLQDPTVAQQYPHPLLALAQRLPSAFEFRVPQDQEDLQYPSVFVANDRDGFVFRVLGSRFEGEWSPALPARNRQLNEQFMRVWERCRPGTELRALAI